MSTYLWPALAVRVMHVGDDVMAIIADLHAEMVGHTEEASRKVAGRSDWGQPIRPCDPKHWGAPI